MQHTRPLCISHSRPQKGRPYGHPERFPALLEADTLLVAFTHWPKRIRIQTTVARTIKTSTC